MISSYRITVSNSGNTLLLTGPGAFRIKTSNNACQVGDSSINSAEGIRIETNIYFDLYLNTTDEVYVIGSSTSNSLVDVLKLPPGSHF